MESSKQPLTEQLKSDIAEAVQQAVRLVTDSDGYHRCQLEAGGASLVVPAMTGIPCLFTATRTRVDINQASCGARWWSFPTPVWCAGPKVHPDPEEVEAWTIEHCFVLAGSDIIDFSSWQYTRYFRQKHNVKWGYSPHFVWTEQDSIPARYRRWYSIAGSADCSGVIFTELKKSHDILAVIAQQAKNELLRKGYDFDKDLLNSIH